jgi:hypothetical protein
MTSLRRLSIGDVRDGMREKVTAEEIDWRTPGAGIPLRSMRRTNRFILLYCKKLFSIPNIFVGHRRICTDYRLSFWVMDVFAPTVV